MNTCTWKLEALKKNIYNKIYCTYNNTKLSINEKNKRYLNK